MSDTQTACTLNCRIPSSSFELSPRFCLMIKNNISYLHCSCVCKETVCMVTVSSFNVLQKYNPKNVYSYAAVENFYRNLHVALKSVTRGHSGPQVCGFAMFLFLEAGNYRLRLRNILR
jgi:hypothetical protein